MQLFDLPSKLRPKIKELYTEARPQLNNTLIANEVAGMLIMLLNLHHAGELSTLSKEKTEKLEQDLTRMARFVAVAAELATGEFQDEINRAKP